MNRLNLCLFFWSFANLIFSMEELESLVDGRGQNIVENCKQFIYFDQLATELQAHILLFACSDGSGDDETLFKALQFINNLKRVNLNFFALINSKYITKKIGKSLYQKFSTQIKKNINGFDRLILFHVIDNPHNAQQETSHAALLETLESIESEMQLANREKTVELSELLCSVYILALLKTNGSEALLEQKIKSDKNFINDFFVLCCSLFSSDKISRESNLILLKSLLNHGIDVNHINLAGNTGLIKATAAGNIAIVQILLDYNADPNIRNQQSGFTALMTAISSLIYHFQFAQDEPESKIRLINLKPIMELLLKRGADPNRENSRKLSAQSLVNIYKRSSFSKEKERDEFHIDFSESIEDVFRMH